MKKKTPTRNPKPIRKPDAVPGPVTNRRKANKPIKPARPRTFERNALGFDPVPFDTVPLDLPMNFPEAPDRDE